MILKKILKMIVNFFNKPFLPISIFTVLYVVLAIVALLMTVAGVVKLVMYLVGMVIRKKRSAMTLVPTTELDLAGQTADENAAKEADLVEATIV